MRDIRFRAWDKKNKDMQIITFDEHDYDFGWKVGHDGSAKPKDFAIMQFTGLKDKNGKEIYEGDIVRGYFLEGIKIGDKNYYQDVVSYQDGLLLPFYEQTDYDGRTWIEEAKSIEVIGNIYENPELIK